MSPRPLPWRHSFGVSVGGVSRVVYRCGWRKWLGVEHGEWLIMVTIYIYIYICIYIYISIYIYTYIYIYIYIYISIYLYLSIYIYLYIYLSVTTMISAN